MDSQDLFAVSEFMLGYTYELASIKDIEKGSEWGDMIIVKEGVYFFNGYDKTYMKIETLTRSQKEV